MATPVPASETLLSRRSLLGCGAATGLGIVLVGGFDILFGAETAAEIPAAPAGGPAGYGPLIDDPAGRVALPKSFSYALVAQSGVTTLESGQKTPDRPDGTVAFRGRGGHGSILVNNHEIDENGSDHPVPHLDGLVYDRGAYGGTTTIEVDRDGNRVREYVSLAGTDNNCAGGRTPWRTWLTCEETEDVPGRENALQRRHGYVFEVDPYDQEANRHPHPIKALGRFAHEAVVVDPAEGRLYLTEDAGSPNGLFYRYTPPRSALPLGPGSLKKLAPTAGRLQAMRAYTRRGGFVPDLSVAAGPGTTLLVRWADVPDRDAETRSVRMQFDHVDAATGALVSGPGGPVTRSRKLEGAWWGGEGAYFVASYARSADGSAAQHDGQVWFYDPRKRTVTLQLRFAYKPDASSKDSGKDSGKHPDGPDNITVSPYGGLIIAEDGEGHQHLLGSNRRGRTFPLARNQLSDEEFTGPTFSPDRRILFANVQVPGHVFAIRGPWRRHR